MNPKFPPHFQHIFWVTSLLVPYWLASHFWTSDLPTIPVDLIAIIILFCGRTSWQVLLYFFFIGASASLIFERTYYFSGLFDILNSISGIELLNVPGLQVAFYLAIALTFLAFVTACLLKIRHIAPPIWFYVGIALISCFADWLNGTSHLSGADSRFTKFNFFGSPTLTSALSEVNKLRETAHKSGKSAPEALSLIHRVIDWQQSTPDGSILFILIESMGVPKEPWLKDELLAPLKSVQQNSTAIQTIPPLAISISETQSEGSTVPNEVRFLCGRWTSISNARIDRFDDCIPHTLKRLGLTTHGFHGFSEKMFDRIHSWPRMGFDQWHFKENWSPQVSSTCGTLFEGICDAALLQAAFKSTEQGRVFGYALTLNTHLPLDKSREPADKRFLRACMSRTNDILICQLIDMQRDILRQIVSLAMSSTKPTLIVISGDHPPPFSRSNQRDNFVAKQVPLVIMDTSKISYEGF